jgi:hypothetical protein
MATRNVRYLNWDEDIAGQHEKVFTHLHTPETVRRRQMGDKVAVFSVLDKRQKVIGQVEGGSIERPFVQIDRGQLQEHLNNPPDPQGRRGKTRNLFIAGTPIPSGSVEGDEHDLFIRPGHVSLGKDGPDIFKARTEPGIVRPVRPEHIRRLGPQFEGIVVPPQPLSSSPFGRAARLGSFGIRVVSPDID